MWPGRGFVGRCAREQVAAAYAVYGPKTVLVLARPVAAAESAAAAAGGGPAGGEQQGTTEQRRLVVQEFVLQPSGAWQLSRCGAVGVVGQSCKGCACEWRAVVPVPVFKPGGWLHATATAAPAASGRHVLRGLDLWITA